VSVPLPSNCKRTTQRWQSFSALTGAALAFLSFGLITLWFWLELKSNAIVREIKRVEPRVAGLVAAVREGRSRSS